MNTVVSSVQRRAGRGRPSLSQGDLVGLSGQRRPHGVTEIPDGQHDGVQTPGEDRDESVNRGREHLDAGPDVSRLSITKTLAHLVLQVTWLACNSACSSSASDVMSQMFGTSKRRNCASSGSESMITCKPSLLKVR